MKYQVMRDLTPIEYEALKADIAQRGVLVPIEVDEDGEILDGHHRRRAWEELQADGVGLADYPVTVRRGLTEEQKRNHARSLNVLRRHLTKEERDDLMRQMRADGMTYQQIADAVGVTAKTAHNIAGDVEFCNFTKLTGSDGKHYPPTKTPRVEPEPLPEWAQDEQPPYGFGNNGNGKWAPVPVIEPVRQPLKWSASEIERRKRVEEGMTVHANMKTDLALIEWAKDNELFVRVDRATEWGNPFHYPDDGDRLTVVENYQWYLDHRPSLLSKIDSLRGTVLGCWCYPEMCHAEVLEEYADDRAD